MLKSKIIIGIVLYIAVSACAVKVQTTYDPNIDFSNYKSFCWLEGCEFTFSGPSYLDDSTFRENIKNSIIDELISKGLKQDEENPDLLIDFHITIENEQMVIYHDDLEEEYPNDYRGEPEYIEYLKGTLIIDIVDKNLGKMVWRSAAISYLDIDPNPNLKYIKKGISIALNNFPPETSN